jgi:hypothetical protein
MGRSAEEDARVENVFRDANEQIQRRVAELSLTESLYLCECADQQCREVLRLAADEYAAVRARSERFVVLPGHASEHETVVERTDRFEVVEKGGGSAEVARGGDARRR